MEGQFCHAWGFNGMPSWTPLFAKEPEPDVDVELDEPGTARHQPSPFGSPVPQKPPRRRMLILIVLLLVVAGGAYLAMDPETVMKLIGQESPRSVSPRPPTTAGRPAIVPRPAPPTRTDADGSSSPAAPDAIPAPLFGEGQHVSAVTNPDSLRMTSSSLSQDAAGTIPGPIIRPADTLIVLDAEMRNRTWVYLVRTEEGAKGWIAETQLAAKP